ncbi:MULTISPECIES: class I SAM-dependent methyltransferase [Spirulina sp. CCY15215]|uniref:class I SAM-dependent methyltransferase n=1 Tax=Spirulina sp. CCY15215 TaxID=2767591 RepID=UPI001951F5AE|nr:class I SAM-dependent methyltransferase [Spirulina major]
MSDQSETNLESSLDSDRIAELAASHYGEFPFSGRYAKAFQWVPDRLETFLDAGCAWGYGTRFFREKSQKIYALEPDATFIAIAKYRYNDIEFIQSPLEKTPFASEFFDAIITCDTLEHVQDEVLCLSEIFRILKPEGILVITTPHRGLFGFLDPENAIPYVEYFVRRYLGWLFQFAYWFRKGKISEQIEWKKPVYDRNNTHRHYTKEDLLEFLDRSEAKGKYEVIEVFRSGLFLGAFVHNLEFYITLFFKETIIKKVANFLIIKPLKWLAEIDYWIPYSIFSYNIALKIFKTQ